MPRQSRYVSRYRAPACTHVSMERIPLNVSDGLSCPSCGNCQVLPFLYICRQDRDLAHLDSLPLDESDAVYLAKSSLRLQLEQIGLSESVIATAEQGLYTGKQLEKLKAKKMELNRVVAAALHAAQTTDAMVQVAFSSRERSNIGMGPSGISHTQEFVPSCQFRACHACRPYLKDRISTSFDAVFEDKIRPLPRAEANLLPVRSAQILRNMTCHPVPASLSIPVDAETPSTVLMSSACSDDSPSLRSQSSMYTYKTTQSEIDTLNTTRRHRRRFYKMGYRSSGELSRDLSRQLPLFSRQGLKEAFKGVFRTGARDSSSSGSNITLPMPHTAAARDSGDVSAVGEFDMGALRRVKRQKDRFDLRQELRNWDRRCVRDDSHCAMRRRTPSSGDGESDSSSSLISVYSFASEGGELEVDGGVALTEEAVETHTPDIVSEPVALESIMTQV